MTGLTTLQGGRRRRRPLPALLVAVAVLAGGGGIALGLAPGGHHPPPLHPFLRPPATPPPPSVAPPHAYATRPAPPGQRVSLRFHQPPRSGLLVDAGSGLVLWSHRPGLVLPIASLTKMMTALVVAAHDPPGARVRITHQALDYQGSGVGLLPLGKRVRVEPLLYGLLLPSGNDAAIALAQRVGVTVPGFVALMNQRASELNLRCTRFSSPSGFEDRGNHSCAADLAVMARDLLGTPRLARIVRRRQAVVRFPIKGGHLFLYNNNPLLRLGYRGADGVKTGFTNAAGRCLVASARRAGTG